MLEAESRAALSTLLPFRALQEEEGRRGGQGRWETPAAGLPGQEARSPSQTSRMGIQGGEPNLLFTCLTPGYFRLRSEQAQSSQPTDSHLYKTDLVRSPASPAPGQRTLGRLPGGKESATRTGRKEFGGGGGGSATSSPPSESPPPFKISSTQTLTCSCFMKPKVMDSYHSGLQTSQGPHEPPSTERWHREGLLFLPALRKGKESPAAAHPREPRLPDD